jgi:hypothetical protein
MSYAPILRNLPEELRFTMLELIEAVEENMRDQLAVRREDFDALHTTVREVADVQYQTVERVDRLETAIVRLAEAQERTEERVGELVEAQTRSEGRLDRLEAAVIELTEAQKQSEGRLERLEAAVIELTEAQKRSEGRLDRLEAAVAELVEAQKQTELSMKELAEAQERLTDALERLTKRVDRHDIKLDKLIGSDLERRYRESPFGYFGRLLRKARTVDLRDIEDELESHLSEAELDDLRLADVVVYGRPKLRPDIEGVWLVVEVSAVVDRNDVERAQRRAAALRKAGYPAVATVAGEERTEGAQEAAQSAGVLFLQNGGQQNWEDALNSAFAV